MHFKNLKKQKGFTLIEVLIYIAVSAVMIVVVVGFARELLKVRNKITIVSKVEQNARYAMSRMVKEIREAQDVEVLDQNTIILQAADVNRNPVIFDLGNGILYMKEGAGDLIAITGNDVKVGEVLFEDRTTPNSADIIKITLLITHPDTNLSPDSQASVELDTYVARR